MNSYRLVVPKRGCMPDFFHVGWWFGSISVTFSPNYHTRFTSLPNHLLCYFPTHCPSTYCVFFICQISTFSNYFWDLIFVSIWWLDTIFRSDTLLQCNAAAAEYHAGATAGLGASRRTASQHWRPALIWNNLIHVAWHREPHKIPCCSRIPCCCKIPCRDFC